MNVKTPSSWLFPHPLAWAVLVVLFLVTGIWSYVTGFEFHASELNTGFAGMGLLLMIAIWCSYRQIMPVVPYVTFSILFFAGMGFAVLMISYLGIAANFDLIDKQLAAFDRALGFDWPAHVRWVNDHPAVMETLVVTYNLINKVMGLTFVALLALKKYDRLKEILFLFLMISSVTVVVGSLLPAIGAYSYYNLPADQIANLPAQAGRYYLDHFNALRDGSMTSLDLMKDTGIIQFPSFHTALALLVPWALRRTVVFWPMALVNLIMVVSTLSQGGHHLADVLAGAVLCVVAIWLYQFQIVPALARKDAMAYQNNNSGFNATSGLPSWLHNMIATLTKTRPTTSP